MKLQGLDAWLHCLLTDGLGPARWLALMQRWGEPEAVLAARQDVSISARRWRVP